MFSFRTDTDNTSMHRLEYMYILIRNYYITTDVKGLIFNFRTDNRSINHFYFLG